jgi:hypothetical protein
VSKHVVADVERQARAEIKRSASAPSVEHLSQLGKGDCVTAKRKLTSSPVAGEIQHSVVGVALLHPLTEVVRELGLAGDVAVNRRQVLQPFQQLENRLDIPPVSEILRPFAFEAEHARQS